MADTSVQLRCSMLWILAFVAYAHESAAKQPDLDPDPSLVSFLQVSLHVPTNSSQKTTLQQLLALSSSTSQHHNLAGRSSPDAQHLARNSSVAQPNRTVGHGSSPWAQLAATASNAAQQKQVLAGSLFQGALLASSSDKSLAPDETSGSTASFVGLYGFVWLVLGVVAYHGYKRYYLKFVELKKAGGEDFDTAFHEYLYYKFSLWFVWTKRSKEIVLASGFLLAILVVSSVYRAFVGGSIGKALYQTFNMLVDPGGAQAQPTYAGQVIGVPTALTGLVIFAVLLAVVQDGFNEYLESLKQGGSPVIEKGHVVVLGFYDDTASLLQELCLAFKDKGGTTIVVLADQPKTEIEEAIQDADLSLYGTQIVARQGAAHNISDLKMAAADTCATIILMADRKIPQKSRDASIMQGLIALCSQGWPIKGRITAVCSTACNQQIFEEMGGEKIDIVMLDSFLGNLLHECSVQPGFGSVIHSLFGFEGSDICLQNVPRKLVGCSFADASTRFPQAVLIGVVTGKGTGKPIVKLCPARDYVLQPDDDLVILAEDDSAVIVLDKTYGPISSDQRKPKAVRKAKNSDTALILGWNGLVGSLLRVFDEQACEGSTVIIYSPVPVEDRQESVEKLKQTRDFANIAQIEHVVGTLGARTELNELTETFAKATRIFVLADQTAESSENADTQTIATVLQTRDILRSASPSAEIPLVPEITNFSTEELCDNLGLTNFVDSAKIPSQVLAGIAVQPEIAPVLLDLTSGGDGVDIIIRAFEDYQPPDTSLPSSICFVDAARWVSDCGDILIGWSMPADSADVADDARTLFSQRLSKLMSPRPGGGNMRFEINPLDKLEKRPWRPEHDKVVILTFVS